MREFNFDFNKNANKYFTVSLAIFAVIIAFICFKGVTLDIQFKGGSIITYSYNGSLSEDDFLSTAAAELGEGLSLQKSTDIASGLETFVLALPGNNSLEVDKLDAVTTKLRQAFPQNNIQAAEISNVNPTIGGEFLAKSMVALAFATALVLLYVASRFRNIGGLSAGAMGVVALLHDCFVAFGVFVIAGIPLDDNFIAVILTILGFSLNDTIVIYDRVRENMHRYGKKMQIGELVSMSINQSLTRSVNTSIAAILSMVVVTIVAAIYSVESIMSFSIPLIVGLISGSYSTICIAGPLWIKWQEYSLARHSRKKRGA